MTDGADDGGVRGRLAELLGGFAQTVGDVAEPVHSRLAWIYAVFKAWTAKSDVRLLLVFSIGLYLLFWVFGSILGLDFNGTVNTLQRITFLSAVYAMLVLALNLQWGYAGLFNIGVAGFMAVGVYFMAILSRPASATPPGFGLPLPVGILGGMFVAGVVGAIVALPALRLRADYLAIVTLGFSEIIRLTIRSQALEEFMLGGWAVDIFGFTLRLPGGKTGFKGTDSIRLPPDPVGRILYENPEALLSDPSVVGERIFSAAESVDLEPTVAEGIIYALFLVLVVALYYVLLVRIGNSPFGRVLKAIRDDETVASALGKDTRLFKIKAFAVGSALMGLAAMLWWLGEGRVQADSFLPITTFYVFVALIIGGAGSNTGSVLGGAVFASLLFEGPQFVKRIVGEVFDVGRQPNTIFDAFGGLDEFLAYFFADVNISALRLVLLGVILILLIQRRPDGLLGHRREVASSIDLSERESRGDDQ